MQYWNGIDNYFALFPIFVCLIIYLLQVLCTKKKYMLSSPLQISNFFCSNFLWIFFAFLFSTSFDLQICIYAYVKRPSFCFSGFCLRMVVDKCDACLPVCCHPPPHSPNIGMPDPLYINMHHVPLSILFLSLHFFCAVFFFCVHVTMLGLFFALVRSVMCCVRLMCHVISHVM